MRKLAITILLGAALTACSSAATEQPAATEAPADSAAPAAPEATGSAPDTAAPGDMDVSQLPGDPATGELQTTASGLGYIVMEEGTGAAPQAGDSVNVEYAGYLLDGKAFDSGAIPFRLGEGAVIKGWDEGVAMMKVGGRLKLVIPPDLAYGAAGRPPIPPNATLVFDVHLVDVNGK